MVDGGRAHAVTVGEPAYVSGVLLGEHVVSLSDRDGCSVETGPQMVTLTAGNMIRDTVEVTFSVRCRPGTIQITAPTTGTIPRDDYSVWLCYDSYSCSYHFPARRLGRLAPNGTLIAEVDPGTYWFHLENLSNCQVDVPNPRRNITVGPDQLVSVSFSVVCP